MATQQEAGVLLCDNIHIMTMHRLCKNTCRYDKKKEELYDIPITLYKKIRDHTEALYASTIDVHPSIAVANRHLGQAREYMSAYGGATCAYNRTLNQWLAIHGNIFNDDMLSIYVTLEVVYAKEHNARETLQTHLEILAFYEEKLRKLFS